MKKKLFKTSTTLLLALVTCMTFFSQAFTTEAASKAKYFVYWESMSSTNGDANRNERDVYIQVEEGVTFNIGDFAKVYQYKNGTSGDYTVRMFSQDPTSTYKNANPYVLDVYNGYVRGIAVGEGAITLACRGKTLTAYINVVEAGSYDDYRQLSDSYAQAIAWVEYFYPANGIVDKYNVANALLAIRGANNAWDNEVQFATNKSVQNMKENDEDGEVEEFLHSDAAKATKVLDYTQTGLGYKASEKYSNYILYPENSVYNRMKYSLINFQNKYNPTEKTDYRIAVDSISAKKNTDYATVKLNRVMKSEMFYAMQDYRLSDPVETKTVKMTVRIYDKKGNYKEGELYLKRNSRYAKLKVVKSSWPENSYVTFKKNSKYYMGYNKTAFGQHKPIVIK